MEINKRLVEKLAREYAEQQNSCYVNDLYGFIEGFWKAIELTCEITKTPISGEELIKILTDKRISEATYIHPGAYNVTIKEAADHLLDNYIIQKLETK